MNSHYDITVVVGTYNPNWKKLKATLLSIVGQKNVKVQIVVSDDGSANPLHQEIKAFFVQIGFHDYKLVKGEKNEGTVRQFYRGLCASDADYIKPFSAGDLLYDEMILSKWLAFTKENDADITFGDSVFYNRKDGKLNVIRHVHNPRNMAIYKTVSAYRDKVINYVCLQDGIYGAAKIAKKSILLYYIKLLLHRVIYAEDYFIRLAVLDKRKVLYYPFKVIWYEFNDGGISTSGENKWIALMLKDNIAMDEICLDKWINPDTEIRKWILENIEFKKIKNPNVFVKFTRLLKHPKWFYWRIYRQLFREYSPTDVDDTFFNYCYGQTIENNEVL